MNITLLFWIVVALVVAILFLRWLWRGRFGRYGSRDHADDIVDLFGGDGGGSSDSGGGGD